MSEWNIAIHATFVQNFALGGPVCPAYNGMFVAQPGDSNLDRCVYRVVFCCSVNMANACSVWNRNELQCNSEFIHLLHRASFG